MGKLTAGKIKSLSLPGLYGDGGTLYLAFARGGSKSWVQRVTIHGRRCDIGLGGYPVVTLARARHKALDNRRLIRDGGDPLAEKRKARAPSFAEPAVEAFAMTAPRLRSEKARALWMAQLERHALPKIGREGVLRVLTPIEHIASHCEPYSPWCSKTSRTARSRTSAA